MASLPKAICNLFNADANLQSSVPGGLAFGQARADASWPYAVLRNPSDVPTYSTEGASIRVALFDVVLVANSDSEAVTAKDHIEALFNSTTFALTFDEGSLMHCLMRDSPISLEQDNPTRVEITYQFEFMYSKEPPA